MAVEHRDGEGISRADGLSRDALVFSSFRLDRTNERLWRGDELVKLSPKALALLLYLAERPHRLLSKHELLGALWGDAHVGEAVLKTHLNQVRRAIGDDVRSPRFIETVARRGYRFIASVSPGPLVRHDAKLSPGRSSPDDIVVGREPEIGLLKEALERSWNGKRQLTFVTGEAGIGKTSVVNSFTRGLNGRSGVLVAHGHCVEHRGRAEAYLPILAALASACRNKEGGHIADVLRRCAPNWLLQLPELLDLGPHPTSPTLATPERMLREMAAAIPFLTQAVPLVLVLEDLQWSDHLTLELIDYLASSPEPARLLLIGTYRPQQTCRPQHPLRAVKRRLDARQHCLEIELGFLAKHDVSVYLDARFERHALPPRFVRALQAHTAGNPLFMVRVTDDLVSAGALRLADGEWKLIGDVDVVGRCVPGSVAALIDHDIEQLDAFERRVLETASVAGRKFCSLSVAEVAEENPLQVEQLCLGWSNERRFFRVERVVELASGAVTLRCAFLHPLCQQLTYARIGPARRADFHRRMALWAERIAKGVHASSPSLARTSNAVGTSAGGVVPNGRGRDGPRRGVSRGD